MDLSRTAPDTVADALLQAVAQKQETRSRRGTRAKTGSQMAPRTRKTKSRPEAEIKIGSQTAPQRAFLPVYSSPRKGL
jgi:hypothetical protein